MPINLDRLDLTSFVKKAEALARCIYDFTDLPLHCAKEFEKVRERANTAKTEALREAERLGLSLNLSHDDVEGNPRLWHAAWTILNEVDNMRPGLHLVPTALERALEMLKRARGKSEPPTHSCDFTCVNWNGTEYRFTKGLQAESVRLLWEAWKSGTPRLSEKTIGENAGSSNDRFRLEHVFKPSNKKTGKREPHLAWGTMIKSVGKGIFALSSS